MSEPMGVSQWREYGKKYGYWGYFRKAVIQEVLDAAPPQRVMSQLFKIPEAAYNQALADWTAKLEAMK